MKLDKNIPYLAQHNVDSGAFHTDPMHEACQPHETPSLGLHSNNVKRSYNGRKAAKASLGVTGGRIAEADVQPVVFHLAPINGRHARRRARKGTQRDKW